MKRNKLNGAIITCAECGQMMPINTYHTYESCLLHKLNKYRISLGKQPIEIDLEKEDKEIVEEKVE